MVYTQLRQELISPFPVTGLLNLIDQIQLLLHGQIRNKVGILQDKAYVTEAQFCSFFFGKVAVWLSPNQDLA